MPACSERGELPASRLLDAGGFAQGTHRVPQFLVGEYDQAKRQALALHLSRVETQVRLRPRQEIVQFHLTRYLLTRVERSQRYWRNIDMGREGVARDESVLRYLRPAEQDTTGTLDFYRQESRPPFVPSAPK